MWHCNRINSHSSFGPDFWVMYSYNLSIKHWIPQTIIAGIIITSWAVYAGIINDNDTKVENQLKTQSLPTMTMFSIITMMMIIKLLFRVIQNTHLIMTKRLRH